MPKFPAGPQMGIQIDELLCGPLGSPHGSVESQMQSLIPTVLASNTKSGDSSTMTARSVIHITGDSEPVTP